MRTPESILVVRLGALGDIVHTLPAVASLKLSFPDRKLIWVLKAKWHQLVEGNPFIDEVVLLDHRVANAFSDMRRLRELRPRLVFDFQGLIQSAVIGKFSRPGCLWGFHASIARERFASLLYNCAPHVRGPHRIERNLQLVQAAGGSRLTDETWLPQGREETTLPSGAFVLASPFAGWAGKQWPLESYKELARLLMREGLALVVNLPQKASNSIGRSENMIVQTSSIAGLLYTTRRAAAVVGVDSGPLHVAAALRKPGVAIFGPTDPAATGPYGGSLAVLRTIGAETTYDRHNRIQQSMRSITPDQVFAALMRSIEGDRVAAVRTL